MRWSKAPEVFLQWLRLFASPPLRNRATLGGNLATASPIGDGAPLLLALDARVQLASQRGRRTIPLASFFTSYRRTALAPDELIAAIEIPKPLPEFVRFYKVAKRRMDDISTVAAAMAMDWDASGRIARARFAFGGVAAVPLRALAAEEAVARGQRWNDAAVERVQAALERTLRSHRRSSRVGRIPAGGRQKSGRKVPVGAAGGGCLKIAGTIAGHPFPHESAREHVTGDALYTDDLLLRFPRAAARLASDCAACACVGQGSGFFRRPVGTGRRHGSHRATMFLAKAIRDPTGTMNRCFPTEVMYHSQPVAWVLGETLEAAQRGAGRVIGGIRTAARDPHHRRRDRWRRVFTPLRCGWLAAMRR